MKRVTFRMLVCVLVMWSLTTVTFAGHGKGYGHLKQQLKDYFQQETEAKAFSGSVLIAKGGEVIFKMGFGMANYETEKANNPETVFALASMSKAFTAMSIMMLEERGMLSVNDLVSVYIPEYPQADQMTIHNLLRMTAGIPDFLATDIIWDRYDQFHYPEELLEAVLYNPLDFAPGTEWSYCNTCYIALGIIIERVSGMTYREFIKANILDPLVMRSTSYDPYEEDNYIIRKTAVAYDDITVCPPLRAGYLHPSIAYSAGGILSNVKDMLKWHRALHSDQLVSYKTLKKIYTPGLGNYGYGWWIDTLEVNDVDYQQIWHWGSYLGYHGIFSYLVDEDLTFIILENTSSPTFSNEPVDDPSDLINLVTNSAAIIFEEANN